MKKIDPVRVIYFTIISLLLIVKFYALSFGVDFRDESALIFLNQRILSGDTVFLDVTNRFQPTIIISYPLLFIYESMTKSTVGIVYFLRVSYFFLSLFVALIVFAQLRKIFSTALAGSISFIPLFLLPFHIPTVFYKSQLLLFFLLSTVFSFRMIADKTLNKNRLATLGLVAGIALGVTWTSYYSFILFIGYFTLVFYFFLKHNRTNTILAFLVGALFPIALWFIIIVSVGASWSDFYRIFFMGNDSYFKFLSKVISFARQFALYAPVVIMIAVVFWWHKSETTKARYNRLLISLILLISIPFISLILLNYYRIWSTFPFFYTFIGIFLYSLSPSKEEVPLATIVCFILPALFGGLIILLTAAHNAHNVGLGMASGLVGFSILLRRYFSQLENKISLKSKTSELVTSATTTIISIAMLAAFIIKPYADPSIKSTGIFIVDDWLAIGSESFEVTHGPYAGLYTTPEKFEIITSITKDLSRFPDSLRIYTQIIGGVGLTTIDRACSSPDLLRNAGKVDRSFDLQWITKIVNKPFLILHPRLYPDSTYESNRKHWYPTSDPVNEYIFSNYRRVITNKYYDIFIPNDAEMKW